MVPALLVILALSLARARVVQVHRGAPPRLARPRLARPRLAPVPRASPALLSTDRSQDFLIQNGGNDVQVLQCATRPVLMQGLIETADLPHICIAGESNAGKSSLLNHLMQKKNLAKASSVAGKTRGVDLFLVNERVVLADLPGLPSRDGQVTQMWEGAWRPLVFEYVKRCKPLLTMLYVHDIRWKVSPRVRDFLADVQAAGLPVMLVLTKDDLLVKSRGEGPIAPDAEHIQRQKLVRRVRRSLGFDGVHLHYSTNNKLPASRKARRSLLRYIESMVKAGSRSECESLLDSIAMKMSDDSDSPY